MLAVATSSSACVKLTVLSQGSVLNGTRTETQREFFYKYPAEPNAKRVFRIKYHKRAGSECL